MRWITKTKEIKEFDKKVLLGRKGPNIGDTKEVIKFSYIPIKVGVCTVWLEKYIEVYEYKKTYTYFDPYNNFLLRKRMEFNDWVLTKRKLNDIENI
jgi:hypothetical protein